MTLADPRYQLPKRKHFTSKLLHEKSSEIQNNVKAQLTKAKKVCLTILTYGLAGKCQISWELLAISFWTEL